MQNEGLLTVDEICEWLHVTKDWVYDEVEASRLPHLKLGRQVRFEPDAVREYLADRRVAYPGAAVSSPAATSSLHPGSRPRAEPDPGLMIENEGTQSLVGDSAPVRGPAPRPRSRGSPNRRRPPRPRPVVEGVRVVITGTHLTSATGVLFGTTKAIGYTVISATQMTALAPPDANLSEVSVTTIQGLPVPIVTNLEVQAADV